ncbi:hypothetical protein GURKE_04890 [Brevundimonas phage vB_BpoS-Gurke]|uniref:Uncharacterized protein n=1 Tax=Brevundimonas phage vB_BpoS-Gurke TaxID=2948599 RepID=A0A9E7SS88_9CAUD|nr:hypothetical protein GURKE_04890 [Brevundimonas phage vB_BpoS-Gurke]
MTAPVTINYIVSLQVEGGAVNPAHIRRSLEFAVSHYMDAEGLTHEDDDGSVTEFQVQPEFLTLSLAQNTDPLTLRLCRQLEDLESGGSLGHYAAQAALAVLANNWSEAGAVYVADAEEAANLLNLYAREAGEYPNAVAVTAHEAVCKLKAADSLTQMADDGEGDYAASLHQATKEAHRAAQAAMQACLQAILAPTGVNAETVNATHIAGRLRDGAATQTMMESILQAAKAILPGEAPILDLDALPPLKR